MVLAHCPAFSPSKRKDMIIRKCNSVNDGSDEIGFHLSLTTADVRRWLEKYVATLANCGVTNFEDTESSLRAWLTNDPLSFLPAKHAERMSKWAISVAIRNRFLAQSATNEKVLLFSESISKRATNAARG